MNEFAQLPLESPSRWFRRLEKVDKALLPLEQRRVHAYFLADARRLLEEEQQKVRWARSS
jgi:hypothetical protein